MKLRVGKLYKYAEPQHWGKEIILYVGKRKREWPSHGYTLLFLKPDGRVVDHFESCWKGKHWEQVGK